MTFKTVHLLLISSTVLVVNCSGVKEEFGLTRRSPDEFLVVERAPLEIPPEFALRPPTPGAPRPQEADAQTKAETALIGEPSSAASAPSQGEKMLLQKATLPPADPNIRQTIDAEAAATAEQNQITWQRLIRTSDKINPSNTPVVDAAAERARIDAEKKSGQAITGEKTPVLKP